MEYGTYGKGLVEAARKEAACAANRIAGAFGFSREDREDLAQDMVLAVLEKAEEFDPSRGSVRTFVSTVIRGKTLMELRRRKREAKRGKMIPCLHEETVEGDEVVAYHETLDRAICMERMGREEADPFLMLDLCHDVAVALDILTPRQREISRLLMKTDKTTAAARLGVSRQTLYREIEAIREVMTDAGLKSYMQAV